MGKVIDIKVKKKTALLTIFEVADTFLTFDSMPHKKLQKLCYYAQAWYLAFYKTRLIDAHFEAWIHGPICPVLYQEYKRYGWLEIPKVQEVPLIMKQSEEIYEFLFDVYNKYSELSGHDLEHLTHLERPWLEARKGTAKDVPSYAIISDEVMQDYYWSVYEKNRDIN